MYKIIDIKMESPIISDDSLSHTVFKNNPVKSMKMLNKFVKVCFHKYHVKGTVYTIDPVSQTIALMVRNENTGSVDMHLILGKHIQSIEVIGESNYPVIEDLFNKSNNDVSPKKTVDRCDKLMNWLQANMIPIVKQGELLKLGDVLVIHPPYELDNCVSKNIIVLEKIQKLIEAMK